jgi:hypothetical protein
MKQQWQGTQPPIIRNPQIKPDPNVWLQTTKQYNYKQRRSKYIKN